VISERVAWWSVLSIGASNLFKGVFQGLARKEEVAGQHVLISDSPSGCSCAEVSGGPDNIQNSNVVWQMLVDELTYVISGFVGGEYDFAGADLGAGVHTSVGACGVGPGVFVRIAKVGFYDEFGFVESKFELCLYGALALVHLHSTVCCSNEGNQERYFSFGVLGS